MAGGAPDIDALTIDPVRLGDGWTEAGPPIGFVELDRMDPAHPPVLPPFPLIGLGAPDHPAATLVDAVAEPPIGAAALAAAAIRHPLAAAALVDLLRLTPDLPPDRALIAESMGYAMLQGSAEHRDWLADRPVVIAHPPGRLRLDRVGATLWLETDRAAALNAIDRPLRDALAEAFTLAALDSAIERVVWRARGRAFGIGADLAEFGTTRDPASAHAIRRRTLPACAMLGCAARVEVGVHGACVGASLELAAFAGRVVAAPGAWFQLPELAMGIVPGAGGCVSVPRRIGRSRAALLMLSGRRIDAATALRWGLVDAIVDADAVDPGRADDDGGEVAPRRRP